jgi:hypothetical protein
MAFDEVRYRREVLDKGLPLRDDLRWRYQLPHQLNGPAVAESVKEVRACWRRNRSRLKYRPVIDELEAGHLVHQAAFTAAAAGDLGPLLTALDAQNKEDGAGRKRLAAALEDAAAGLGLLPPGVLAELAAGHGTDVGEARKLLGRLKIALAAPERLPEAVPHAAYARCPGHLRKLQLRHLADFLAAGRPGERTTGPVAVFDGALPGGPEVDAAAARWGRLPHGAAQTAAQSVVAAARQVLGAQGPEGLRDVLRYELAAALRDRRAARTAPDALVAYAVRELSVGEADARRLVFAVVHERAADPVTTQLQRLVADGRLAAATALADSFPDEAGPLAERIRVRLDRAVRLRDEASRLRGTDPDRGWTLLDEAELLVTDLPGADDLRRTLAPRPASRVTATPDGSAILLSWDPSPSTVGGPRYLAVRQSGHRPRSPDDGTPLPLGSPAATSVRDAAPPVNTPLYYAVAVRRAAEPDGRPSPLAVCGPVLHRPEVSGSVLHAGEGTVTASWRLPKEAESAEVTRESGGRSVRIAARRDGFTDSGLVNGTVYRYRVKVVYPWYPGQDGVAATTPGVVLSATPTAPPEAVRSLRVEPVAGDRTALVARFSRPHSGEVRLYALDGPPPWPPGTRLAASEVQGVGRPLTAAPTPRGLRFATPLRRTVVLAVTLAGEEAVVGGHELIAPVPDLGRVEARRHGAEVTLAFDWPEHGVGEVEVSWGAPGGTVRRRSVSRAEYLHEAGARLSVPDGAAVEIEARPVDTAGAAKVRGAPSPASLPARIEVAYALSRTGLPGKRVLRAVFTATAATRADRLVLVRTRGATWPLSPDDGEELGALTAVDLAAGQPVELAVPAPGSRRGGYWLRCFAIGGGGAVLRDPPVRDLRVR